MEILRPYLYAFSIVDSRSRLRENGMFYHVPNKEAYWEFSPHIVKCVGWYDKTFSETCLKVLSEHLEIGSLQYLQLRELCDYTIRYLRVNTDKELCKEFSSGYSNYI